MKITETKTFAKGKRGHRVTLVAENLEDREALELLAIVINGARPAVRLADGLTRALANEKPETTSSSGIV